MADPIVGVNYFNHQFLRRDDFERAREYHVERHQQHTRFLHRPGVVTGLEVRPGAVAVAVTHGVALDERGLEVELQTTTSANPVRLRVQSGPNSWNETDVQVGGELQLDLASLPATIRTAYVSIRRGVHPHEPTTDVGLTGDTRLAERAEVQVGFDPPAAGTGWLHLATITRTADGVPFTGSTPSGALAGAVLADDSVTSAKIAEADTAAGQNTNSGTGIKTGHLKDAAVTEAKLAAGAVTETKIGALAVTEGKIGGLAVTEGKIGTGAVTTGKLGNDAVTSAKIAEADTAAGQDTSSGSGIKTGHLKDEAVTEAKLAAGAVTETKIGGLAVTEGKIGTGAVSTGKIANDAVTSAKIAEADAAAGQDTNSGSGIKTGHLKDAAVTTAKLADAAVTTAKLADFSVTGLKLALNSVTSDRIADSSITAAELADLQVTTGKLANLGVTTAKVADGAVTEPKLAAGAVSTRALADGSVTQAKLAAGVGGGGLSPGAVKHEHVAPGAVSVRQMASVLVAAGFVTIPAGQGVYIPSLPLNAGFILHNIWIEEIVGFPATNVVHPEVRLWIYESTTALHGSQVGDPWGMFGRQWWVSAGSQYPLTVGYRFYRVEEVNPPRPIGP